MGFLDEASAAPLDLYVTKMISRSVSVVLSKPSYWKKARYGTGSIGTADDSGLHKQKTICHGDTASTLVPRLLPPEALFLALRSSVWRASRF